MAKPVLRAVPAMLAMSMTTVACTGPDRPPQQTTSVTASPITATPLDVTRFLTEPCSGAPADLTTKLGLPKRSDAHETVLAGAGDQAQCQLSSGPPLSAAAEIRFYPKARPLSLVTGPGSTVKPITINGYPAGEWVLSTGTDGSFTSCQMIIDIAAAQGLGTLYNGPAGEPIATSCAKAKQLAEGVIAALPH